MENIEKKNNGCGDSDVLREELKRAIMELTPENRYKLLRCYAEKYGISLYRTVTETV